jgi:pilus assembly protein Flp/PilA
MAALRAANASDKEWLAMNRIRQRCAGLVHDESGQELIEYALVAGLLVLGTITAMSTLSSDLDLSFNSLSNSLSDTI